MLNTYKSYLNVKSDIELQLAMEAIMLEMAQLEEYRELLVA